MNRINTPYITQTNSGATLIRFSSFYDISWWDYPENNPNGYSIERYGDVRDSYLKKRYTFTWNKIEILRKAKKCLREDKEYLKLIYSAKSQSRKIQKNRFSGSLNAVSYSRGEDKLFDKSTTGSKKRTIDMAFQVGTFVGGDYEDSFISIMKCVLLCQSMNINLNIDLFDSDIRGVDSNPAYVICRMVSSRKKFNALDVLVGSHREFFTYTLFNGYSAASENTSISTFIEREIILQDLSQYYDVIGGNMINENYGNGISEEETSMLKEIIKISNF